jgi:hypothetical protein
MSDMNQSRYPFSPFDPRHDQSPHHRSYSAGAPNRNGQDTAPLSYAGLFDGKRSFPQESLQMDFAKIYRADPNSNLHLNLHSTGSASNRSQSITNEPQGTSGRDMGSSSGSTRISAPTMPTINRNTDTSSSIPIQEFGVHLSESDLYLEQMARESSQNVGNKRKLDRDENGDLLGPSKKFRLS